MRGSYNSIIIFVSNACLAQWGLLSDSPGSCKCLLESSTLHSEQGLSVTEPAPRKAQSSWGKEKDSWVIILYWNNSSRLNIYCQTVFPVLKSPTLKVRVWARLYTSKSWVWSRVTVQNKIKAKFLLQGSSLAWIYCNSFVEWILNWIFFVRLWLEITVISTVQWFQNCLVKVKNFWAHILYLFINYVHVHCTIYNSHTKLYQRTEILTRMI